MHRCIELAKKGAGNVAPNPMVGAVLVFENRIIGEGYHQQYGKPHAEVNCINNVSQTDVHLISQSTLYVSLEPCAHHGKTPPCADLIIQNKIPVVVVGTGDPFKQVDGKGIERMQQAGVKVIYGILENECIELNKRFFTFHLQQRPYIILKWAQTADAKMSSGTAKRLHISNELTNRLVHQWRGQEAAILVGTNTVLLDNPSLNVRLAAGNNPVRLIVDMNLRLPQHLNIFDKSQPTIIFNSVKHTEDENLLYYQLTGETNVVQQILNACFQLKIQSLLVEGGSQLLQSFINDDSWDEIRMIINNKMFAGEGLLSPVIPGNIAAFKREEILTDTIAYFRRNVNQC